MKGYSLAFYFLPLGNAITLTYPARWLFFQPNKEFLEIKLVLEELKQDERVTVKRQRQGEWLWEK